MKESQHKWRAFIGIALLSFGCYLDYTVVNIALPTIQQELQADLAHLQWIMNIYFLALCILATIMGRCGDLYGRRRLFYIGTVIFALASIIAGMASTIAWLILGRFLQGVGAAIVLSLGMSLIPASFPEGEHGKAIGWLGSIGGLALALGPIIGGAIVTYWGWRWIFFINIPIIVLGFLFCFTSVKESVADDPDRSLDWWGMILLALMMAGIVLALIHSEAAGWQNGLTLSYLITGLIAGVILIRVENRQSHPLIDFKDFSKLLFYAASMLIFFAGVLSAVALFFDPLYLQIIRGQSPQLSGLVLFAIPLTLFIVALCVGWLIKTMPLVNIILVGIALAALASLMQIFFKEDTAFGYVLLAFAILGAMWAIGNTVSLIAAQTAVGPARIGVATGTMVTMFNIGGSIGIALAVVIYHHFAFHHLQQLINQKGLGIGSMSYFQQLLANPSHALQIMMSTSDRDVFHDAFIHGFTAVMCLLLMLSAVFLLSIVIGKIMNSVFRN